jgi:UDP-N-acetylglucosamine--N-acetylmuramyl-(pentapeptide) pyrophosphoryl-undecaprenol N-acetylglucosamine transferase
MSGDTFAFVTGGGTGGHVYPALAVADALVERGHPPASLRFVGARRGLEATAVPEAGYEVDLLGGRGLQRSFRPRAIVANIGAVVGLVGAFARAFRLVGRYQPRVVLGVGGYASFPCLLAARLRRVPAVVHEQNAAPGLANRWAVRLGARAAVSLPGTPLPGAITTGNPVRAAMTRVSRHPDAAPPLVAVVGGSLGAGRLNDAALGLYDRWRSRGDVSIRHVAGPRGYDGCMERLSELRAPTDALAYDLVRYEDDMPALYGRTAVLVGRAGAVTCAELAVTGTPSVLVPLPGAPGDHQTRNAEALVDAGAAVLVADRELDGERLGAELRALLDAPTRLDTMSSAARSVGRPDAAARVADLVERAADRASAADGGAG